MAMNHRLLRPRASGGGFDPRSISGICAWFDASDASTVLNSVSPDVPATNGQTVRRWLDKSGAGNHIDQTSAANQPTYNASTLTLTFDGNDSLKFSNLSINRNRPGFCGVGVFTVNSTIVFAQTNIAGSAGTRFEAGGDSGSRTLRIGGRQGYGGTSYIFTGASVNAQIVGGFIVDYVGRSASVRVNGAVAAGGAAEAALDGGNSVDADAGIVVLGGDAGVGFMSGSMREFMLFNGAALTNAQMLSIERYLAAKWGVALL